MAAETWIIPRSADELERLHVNASLTLRANLRRLGNEIALLREEGSAAAIMRTLLTNLDPFAQDRAILEMRCDEIGWREFLDEQSHDAFDELTGFVRQAAGYGGQGIAPLERADQPASLSERKAQIDQLLAKITAVQSRGSFLLGTDFDYLWRAAKVRQALDFGGRIAVEDLGLVAQLPITAIRNAVSIGQLRPDAAGTLPSEEAVAWLPRRREFCPSRWLNPADDQWPFDPAEVVGNERGMVWVPQSTEGDAFTPDRVVRPARSTAGISITVGAKGEERQYPDFYDALTALASMRVARWRRRNSAGHWGIVRARGAWVAVSKEEIDRQLAEKLVEVA